MTLSYSLGAHLQGKDMEAVKHVASGIRSGQVLLNYPGIRTLLLAASSNPGMAANMALKA